VRASEATAGAAADVSAGANQDATSCLDLIAGEKYGDAVPVCSRALNSAPDDAKLKAALELATQKSSEAGGAPKSY